MVHCVSVSTTYYKFKTFRFRFSFWGTVKAPSVAFSLVAITAGNSDKRTILRVADAAANVTTSINDEKGSYAAVRKTLIGLPKPRDTVFSDDPGPINI